jgi:cell cycle sensor histidine kinase DivJ
LRQIEWLIPARDFVDKLVHPSIHADPLVAARHRAFIAAHLAAGIIALACFPAYLAIRGGLTFAEAAALALLASPVLIAVFLARTARLEAAHVLSSVMLCALALVATTKTGGMTSFAVAWLPIVPVEAWLSGSRRVVLWAGAAAIATLCIVCGIDMAGLLPAPTGLAASPMFHAAGVIAAALYASGLALLDQGLHSFGAELSRSGEARYALLAENMNDLVTRHGRAGHVTYASPAAEAVLGAPVSAILGHGLFDRVHVSDRPAYLSALSRPQADGTDRPVEIRLRRLGDGGPTFIWAEMRCRSIGSGEARHVVAVIRDISERKAHEIEVERARAEAEQANAAKSRFLATMSHELRTPLNAVIGFSEMMMSEDLVPLDATRRRDYAALIHDSGHHLLAVVNGILDMSKIETGNFHIMAEPFAVRGLVDSCRNMMLLKAEAGSILVESAVDDALPDLVADKRACRQIFLNLLSNAIKFTPAGGRIVIGARAERHGVALFVEDSGIGIESDDLPRLGEAFFQARSSYDRPYEGTGLGLSVVKGLAQLHGGRMTVESTVGKGTSVVVLMPYDCENEASRRSLAEGSKVERLALRQPIADMLVPQAQGKRRA